MLSLLVVVVLLLLVVLLVVISRTLTKMIRCETFGFNNHLHFEETREKKIEFCLDLGTPIWATPHRSRRRRRCVE